MDNYELLFANIPASASPPSKKGSKNKAVSNKASFLKPIRNVRSREE